MPVTLPVPAALEALRPALVLLVEALLVAERSGTDLRLLALTMRATGEALQAEIEAGGPCHLSLARGGSPR